MPRRSRMQPTLVRFGPELHEQLKAEAELSGVSVAQFVREAVVARIAYNAGRRADPEWGAAFSDTPSGAAQRARTESRRVRGESQAARAEGAQAVRKSESLRRPAGDL